MVGKFGGPFFGGGNFLITTVGLNFIFQESVRGLLRDNEADSERLLFYILKIAKGDPGELPFPGNNLFGLFQAKPNKSFFLIADRLFATRSFSTPDWTGNPFFENLNLLQESIPGVFLVLNFGWYLCKKS